MARRQKTQPFRSAKTELKKLVRRPRNEQTQSPSFEIAFTDKNFLLRQDLRPIRLQLELLKAELIQQDLEISSTVVIFGSARIPEPKKAKKSLSLAQKALKSDPANPELNQSLNRARALYRNSRYYEEARKLSAIISALHQTEKSRNFVVVTGGGPGIMEAANRGAYEIGAKSIGHVIVQPIENAPNPYISPELCFQFHYFAIRKMHFLIRAKAAIFFPGGFGTLDELFETLTLLQTKKMKPIPILLFGKEYWDRVINFNTLIEEGTISPQDHLLFQFVETAEEAWKVIEDFYQICEASQLISKTNL